MSSPPPPSFEQEFSDSARDRAPEPMGDRAGPVNGIFGAPTLLEKVAHWLVPAGIAIASYLFLFADAGTPDANLQLVAPSAVAAGDRMGIRAYVLTNLRDPGSLRSDPVGVPVTLEQNGEVVARAELTPSNVDGGEGSLVVPTGITGTYELVATYTVGEEPLTVRRRVQVEPKRRPGAAPRKRRTHALQYYRAFAPQNVSLGKLADGELPQVSLVVENGGCVPEHPCRVRITAGEFSGRFEVTPRIGFRDPQMDGERRFWGKVHGPEAEVLLVAFLDDKRIMEQKFRLPIVLGGVPFTAPHRIDAEAVTEADAAVNKPIAVELRFPPNLLKERVLVDVFEDGRFVHATSLKVDRGTATISLPPKRGRYRLQFRTDSFGVESATTHELTVGDLPAKVPLEFDVIDLPEPTGSLDDHRQEVERRVTLSRWFLGFIFALGSVFAVFVIVRRGMFAAGQAQNLMAQARRESRAPSEDFDEQEQQEAQRVRIRMTAQVLLAALLILMLFAVGALLVLLKGTF